MTLLSPGYDTSRGLYWFVWVFVILYVIGTGVYIGVFVQNISTVHTYFAQPSLPGSTLLSFRYTFTDVAVRLTVIAHILNPLFIMTLVAYRKDFGCNVVWFALYVAAFLMTLIGLGATAGSYANCNGAQQFGNICNDAAYCCKLLDPKCPNVLPCADPVELHPNADFLGLFWTNVILLVFQIAFVLVVVFFSGGKQKMDEPEEDPEGEEEPAYYAKPSAPEPPLLKSSIVLRPRVNRAHGLRQEKNK